MTAKYGPATNLTGMSILGTFVVWIVVCLALAAPAHEAQAQQGAKITEWNFIGNDAFSDGHLEELMKERHVSRLSLLFTGDDPLVYEKEILAEDLQFLAEFYQREGYLGVEIAPPRVDYDRVKDEVTLTISIAEGIPVRVSDNTYDITKIDSSEIILFIDEINELREDMRSGDLLASGERFRDSTVIIYQDSLNRLFSYHGYPYADPEFELLVDTSRWEVDIVWHIDPGPLAIFGDMRVSGNQEISSGLITGMAAFDAGDRYNQRLVEKTQEQIYGLGVFQIVTVHPVLEDPPLPEIPVEVSVREAPRYRFSLGAGYGREDNFRTFGDIRSFGYLGRARQLRLYARYSSLEPYHVRLTLTQPYFFHPRTALKITPFARRQSERSFEARRIGGEIGVSHVFTRTLSGNANYIYEAVKLVGDTLPPALLLGDTTINSYRKSSILLAGQYDNSAPLFSPVKGVFAAAYLTFSGLGFGSDFNFWKILGEVRHYREVGSFVLAGRLQVGGIQEFDGSNFIPVEERLFAGGGSSVRGWDRHELGPEINGVPIGGQSSIEGSFEVRYPIYSVISGAVFTDFGNVWLESFHYDLGGLRFSAGVGIRVSTPIGPVRVDVAHPIFDEEKGFEIHINVGQAF